MLEKIDLLIVVQVLVMLMFMFWIMSYIDKDNPKIGALIAIKKFIKELFRGRNIFGIIISIIVFIISIPSILLILIIQFLAWFIYIICFMWNLGNKKK